MALIMLTCSDVSKLVSESLEQRLPRRKRIAVWAHNVLCRFCFGFARQLRLLDRAIRDHPERLEPDPASSDGRLSDDARERIKSILRNSE